MKNKLEISKEIRRNIVKMVYTAKSGHPGVLPFSGRDSCQSVLWRNEY